MKSVEDLNKAVKRNTDRFPEDFMFQLTAEEAGTLRFQIGMSKGKGRGGRRYLPYVFAERGVGNALIRPEERKGRSGEYRNHEEPLFAYGK